MMHERDPLADLLQRLEQPVSPPAPFAESLRRRLLTELADGAKPKEQDMRGAELTFETPRLWSVPRPAAAPVSPTASSRWQRALALIAAAGLLVTLAGGTLLGSRMLPGLLALWQGQEDLAASAGVPMRGVDPGRTGANPGPAPAGVPGLLWVSFAGVGAKTPAVVDGVAYVAGDTGDVAAFEVSNGTERWRVSIGGGMDTPTVVDGIVYIGLVTDSETASSGGALLALDAASGEELWRASTGTFGGASPVVVDGVAYAGGDQELYAFNADTGDQLWRYALDAAPCVCTPRPAAVADGIVYVVPGGQEQASLFAVDAATGGELWRYDGAIAGESMRFTDPVAAAGLVFVGEGALFGDGAGRFAALDAATGVETWALDLDASAAPAVAGDVLYVQARFAGELPGTLYALDPETGAEVWAQSTVETSFAAPVVAGELVLIPGGLRDGYAIGFDDDLLVAFDSATGAERWRIDLAGSISGPPAIVDGAIYVTTYYEGALLYALGDDRKVGGGMPASVHAIDASGRAPCLAGPMPDPYTRGLAGTPTAAVTTSEPAGVMWTVADVPAGGPAGAGVEAEANATLRDLAACVGGDPAVLYGFFSDGYFQRAMETMIATGMAVDAETAVTWRLPPLSPVADLTLRDVRSLPDGRVGGLFDPDGRAGGLFDGVFNPIFAIFIEQDGRWLIDELVTVIDSDRQPGTLATPVP